MAHHVLVLLDLWLSGLNAGLALMCFLNGRWRLGAFNAFAAIFALTLSFL